MSLSGVNPCSSFQTVGVIQPAPRCLSGSCSPGARVRISQTALFLRSIASRRPCTAGAWFATCAPMGVPSAELRAPMMLVIGLTVPAPPPLKPVLRAYPEVSRFGPAGGRRRIPAFRWCRTHATGPFHTGFSYLEQLIGPKQPRAKSGLAIGDVGPMTGNWARLCQQLSECCTAHLRDSALPRN